MTNNGKFAGYSCSCSRIAAFDLERRVFLVVLMTTSYLQLASVCMGQEGFVSVDCGATAGKYKDRSGIQWVSDAGEPGASFASSMQGVGVSVAMPVPVPAAAENKYYDVNDAQRLSNLRYFPGEQSKYCYVFTQDNFPFIKQGTAFLVRAAFWAANLTFNLSSATTTTNNFQLLINADIWDNVTIKLPQKEVVFKEAYMLAANNNPSSMSVCLAGRRAGAGAGIPFISSLELRLLPSGALSKEVIRFLDRNHLFGGFPDLTNLKKLQTLLLDNNSFSGDVPQEILYRFSKPPFVISYALAQIDALNVAPPTWVYLSLLRACIRRKSAFHAKSVYAQLQQRHVKHSGLVGDYLITTLAKCGCLNDARKVFDTLPSRTVFSWTAMICAYVECGYSLEALQMYVDMQKDGVEPDAHTFVSLLKACGDTGDLDQEGDLENKMGEPSSSWQNFNFRDDEGSAQGMQALRLLLAKLQEAQANPRLKPSVNNLLMTEDLMLTSTQRLPSSVAPMHLEGGEGVPVMHGPMQANVVPHPLQGPLQTDGAKKKQYHDQEKHVGKIREEGDFHDDDDKPPSRSRHKKRINERCTKRSRRNSSGGSSSSSQSGRSSHGRFPKKVLSAYVDNGHPKKALLLFRQLHEESIKVDDLTYNVAPQACSVLADMEDITIVNEHSVRFMSLAIGQALHSYSKKVGFSAKTSLGTTLVKMYGKCGTIEEAENAFCGLSKHDVVSWSAILSAYVENGLGKKALQLFRYMQQIGEGDLACTSDRSMAKASCCEVRTAL
ncbi:hypothetical protein L7F22_061848 [Adiantum nelumboides]|nr:hypothetical protein [Adiantum nelumboides]